MINFQSVFIVAEIGANHNGDPDLARQSIEAAKECGVDAVKFQTYTSAELLCDTDRLVTWESTHGKTTERVADMFDRIALKREYHQQLFEYANSIGLVAFSTPFSPDGVRFLDRLGVPIFKIASSDVNYTDLLETVASTGKPAILSVGKSTLAETDMAVNYLERHNCRDIALMHCIALYPTAIEEVNLKVINTLAALYPEYPIGFSDHSLGITASLGAVALGARIIEKHFTLDNTMDGPDHWFSMNPKTMKRLVAEIRNLEAALGSPRKRVIAGEKEERRTAIRSLVVVKEIKRGEVLTRSHLGMLRPGYGISPFDLEKVLGMKVRKNLPAGTVLTWDDLK